MPYSLGSYASDTGTLKEFFPLDKTAAGLTATGAASSCHKIMI